MTVGICEADSKVAESAVGADLQRMIDRVRGISQLIDIAEARECCAERIWACAARDAQVGACLPVDRCAVSKRSGSRKAGTVIRSNRLAGRKGVITWGCREYLVAVG